MLVCVRVFVCLSKCHHLVNVKTSIQGKNRLFLCGVKRQPYNIYICFFLCARHIFGVDRKGSTPHTHTSICIQTRPSGHTYNCFSFFSCCCCCCCSSRAAGGSLITSHHTASVCEAIYNPTTHTHNSLSI